MITMKQAHKLLSLAEEVEADLKGLYITIKEGSSFNVHEGLLEYNITVCEQGQEFRHNIIEWLRNSNGLKDYEVMFNEFENVFSFFHELGHILTSWTIDNDQKDYDDFRNKKYVNKEEAFKEYRNIPAEKLADCKALELIRKLLPDLYMIFNGSTSRENAINEINFWKALY